MILSDVVVLGNTPFAAAAQEKVKAAGLSCYLVYTGDTNIKHLHFGTCVYPHTRCDYTVVTPYRKGYSTAIHPHSYLSYLTERFGGGGHAIFDAMAQGAKEGVIPGGLTVVPPQKVVDRWGYVGGVSALSTTYRTMTLDSGETLSFGKLLVTEDLRTLLDRIGMSRRPRLGGKDAGLLLEEFVDLLPLHLELPLVTNTGRSPAFSISRGFLKYHYIPGGGKCNVRIKDYIKTQSPQIRELLCNFENKGILCFGPRATWNTSLSQESEILRLGLFLEELRSN